MWRNAVIYFAFNTLPFLYAQGNVTQPILEIGDNLNKNLSIVTENKIFPNDASNNNVTFQQNNDSQIVTRMVTYCTTPNGESAFCLPIKNCTKLMNQSENNNARKFLQESSCGPKNYKDASFVCCGKYSNYRHQEKNPLPKTCGYQNITIRGRIMGGKEAKLGEFPWLARLYHRDKRGKKIFGCSGFLIASKFVLTAAHCLESDNNDVLGPVSEVYLGEHDTDTDVDCTSNNKTCADELQIIKVKKIIAHPSYDMNSRHHHNDIGLIHLKKSAKFTPYVSPICLVESLGFEPFEYWLSGWGHTETDTLSHIKLKVSVPPFLHSNCTKKYTLVNIKIIDKQLCAGGKRNKDSCTGDSGGPLMVADRNHWFAAGVVSYGLGCGKEGWPAVYTNITSYSDWLKSTITKQLKANDKSKNATTKN